MILSEKSATFRDHALGPMKLAPGPARLILWVEEPVQMPDEIAHMGVIDGTVGGVLPGVIGFSIVRIDADDIEGVEVGELHTFELGELAAKDEVEQLPAALSRSVFASHGRAHSLRAVCNF